jgi:hypothetical protein
MNRIHVTSALGTLSSYPEGKKETRAHPTGSERVPITVHVKVAFYLLTSEHSDAYRNTAGYLDGKGTGLTQGSANGFYLDELKL